MATLPAKPNIRPHKITIIGGGASCHHVIKSIYNNSQNGIPIEIEIIEASNKIGLGLAWDPDNLRPWHYMNQYADEAMMQSIEEFDVVSPNIAATVREGYNPQRGEIPRAYFGADSQWSMEALLKRCASRNITITKTLNTSVNDIRKTENGYVVITDKGEEKPSDYVVLATGHWQQKNDKPHEGVYDSPWPASKIEAIDSNQPIAILGSSLSAVDAALTLAHKAGRFQKRGGKLRFIPNKESQNFRLDMFSPHGMLPVVLGYNQFDHGAPDHVIALPDSSGSVTAQTIYKAFKTRLLQKLETKYHLPTYLQRIKNVLEACPTIEKAVEHANAVIKNTPSVEILRKSVSAADASLDMKEPIFWHKFITLYAAQIENYITQMNGEDQHYFTHNVRPILQKLHAGMVLSNAEKMLALMESGALQLHALGTYATATSQGKPGMEIHYTDAKGAPCSAHYQAVVKATGDDLLRLQHSSDLMKNLFKSGLAQENLVPYKSQELGAKHAAEEQENGTPRRVILKSGMYCFNAGGIKTDKLFRTTPCFSTGQKPEYVKLYAIGPILNAQSPLLEGFAPMRKAARLIGEHIVASIAQEYNQHAPEEREGLLFSYSANDAIVVVVGDNTPADARMVILDAVAGRLGKNPLQLDLKTFSEVPEEVRQLVLAQRGKA